jgi:uncharacterized protein YukE
LRRGHRPIVYSPKLGEIAGTLATRGVSVIDDIRKLGEPPDIIHAHHSIPAGEALIRFPHVPALYVCHSFSHWLEAPVHFPQIGAYVAVDEACRDRLVHQEGIDPKRIVVLYNAVDLARIPPRPHPLQSRPLRGLAFGKAAYLPQLRTACERLGIHYDALGAAAGRWSEKPEQELVNFDLVFASARAALEALCCGCAVIVCDHRGLAGLVTSQNFAWLRERNFGLRTLDGPVTVDRCVQEIERYDPTDALLAAEKARKDADLERLLDTFEKLYSEVLTGARRPLMGVDEHDTAVARFLHEYLPRQPFDSRWPWMEERELFQSRVQLLEAALVGSSDQMSTLERVRAETQDQLGNLTRERDRLQQKLQALQSGADARLTEFAGYREETQNQLGNLTRECDKLRQELQVLQSKAQDQVGVLTHERDKLQQKLQALQSDAEARLIEFARYREETQNQLGNLTRECDKLRQELQALQSGADARLTEFARYREETQNQLGNLTRECDKLRQELQVLQSKAQDQVGVLTRERDKLGQELQALQAVFDVIKHSRLLKLGRFLRRLLGRPIPY